MNDGHLALVVLPSFLDLSGLHGDGGRGAGIGALNGVIRFFRHG